MNDMANFSQNNGERPKISHSIQATERREITVHGVREVLSFDDANVRLVTTLGILNLEGRELRIHVLNTRDGVVAVTGTLCGLLYEDEAMETAPEQAAKRFRLRRRLD